MVFLPLKLEVCFALPSLHESHGRDDFPRSGRAERRGQWKTWTALFSIKKDSVTLDKRTQKYQISFCTPSLIRDMDKHVEK